MRTDALPQTCPAVVWVDAGHAVYLGPSLGLAPHATSVDCVVFGVDAPFEMLSSTGTRSARSMFVPARLSHQVVSGGGRMLFVYFDPGSARARACREQMNFSAHGFGFDHAATDDVLGQCRSADVDVSAVLDLTGGPATRDLDVRVARVVEMLRADPDRPATVGDAAAAVGLSDAYFQRLFAAHTGTSFRRYRLWARMLVVVREVSQGRDLTTAAAQAGFSSPSHFSDVFREMFGLTASTLLATGVTFVVGP